MPPPARNNTSSNPTAHPDLHHTTTIPGDPNTVLKPPGRALVKAPEIDDPVDGFRCPKVRAADTSRGR